MNKNSYFGFLVIASAMLGAMALSSCSHDDFGYSEEKVEQAVNAKYAAAFEKAFGKVGSDVDWGFSNKIYDARAITRAGGEVYEPTITFPGDCNASNFLADWPVGTNKLSPNGSGSGSWYINEAYNMVQTYGGASKLYVKGNIDLSAGDNNAQAPRFQVSTTSEIYLLEGATLKIGKASAENFIGAAVYIAEGATLETTEKLKINNLKVYTQSAKTTQNGGIGGIIKVKDLEVNTSGILYNSGTVIATGTVSVESPESRIVNNGEIECKDVVVNAGAVRNFVNWNVKGTTYINTSNSGWINDGQWTTYDFTYVSGSKNVINNCHLKVNNDFYINLSSLSANNDADMGFKINSGGSVETNNFIGGRHLTESNEITGGPFRIYMAENSLFKVTNTATLESSRGPISDNEVGFGFFGPSEGGYAVFQAKDIVRDPYLEGIKSHGAVTYGDNLYVSAETHFAQGYDSDGSGSVAGKPFIYEQGSFSIANNIYAAGSGFQPGKPSITIEETPCCPGFYGGDPLYRVIAEDLSAAEAGDFDFNDVVFDVVKAEGGYTTLRLICAGGVLPLRVRGAEEAETESQEIHAVFGDTTPLLENHPMYNTGAGPTVDPVEFTVKGTYLEPKDIKDIIIEVYKEGKWMELKATTGKAACKILVDDTFVPVSERSNIANDYGLFTKYVQGEFLNEFWWKKK